MKPTLIIVSTLLSLIGTSDYIVSILKGKTRPHRTTRIVLFLVSTANLVGALAAHAALGTLILSILFFARSVILAFLSIKRGIGGATRLDLSCGLIAVLGIIAWIVSGSGILALVFAVVADAVAYIPAVVKTWKMPKTEAPLLYWLEGVAAILAVIHDGWRFSIIFQAYVVLSCVTMLACIYRPKLGNSEIADSIP